MFNAAVQKELNHCFPCLLQPRGDFLSDFAYEEKIQEEQTSFPKRAKEERVKIARRVHTVRPPTGTENSVTFAPTPASVSRRRRELRESKRTSEGVDQIDTLSTATHTTAERIQPVNDFPPGTVVERRTVERFYSGHQEIASHPRLQQLQHENQGSGSSSAVSVSSQSTHSGGSRALVARTLSQGTESRSAEKAVQVQVAPFFLNPSKSICSFYIISSYSIIQFSSLHPIYPYSTLLFLSFSSFAIPFPSPSLVLPYHFSSTLSGSHLYNFLPCFPRSSFQTAMTDSAVGGDSTPIFPEALTYDIVVPPFNDGGLESLPRDMQNWTRAQVIQWAAVVLPQFCLTAERHQLTGVDLVSLDVQTASRLPFAGRDESLAQRLVHLINAWHEKVNS